MHCMMYDIIVFKNLRFRPSTRKQYWDKLAFSRNSTTVTGTVLDKLRFGPENTVYV